MCTSLDGGRWHCFSEPISLSIQKVIWGLNCSDLAKDNSTVLQAVVKSPPQYSWGQLCVDGYNVNLGKFLLLVWVFLNICPEAAAINPFLESKQTHREGGEKPEAMEMPPGGSLVDREDIWTRGGKGSWQGSEHSVQRPSPSYPLLLQQGNKPNHSSFFFSVWDSREGQRKLHTGQLSLPRRRACNPSFCSKSDRTWDHLEEGKI